MYNNNNSRFADSGYLSRTPTPPTPTRIPSPQPMHSRQELETNGSDSNKIRAFIICIHFVQKWTHEFRIILQLKPNHVYLM
jgi:hypothetical protein